MRLSHPAAALLVVTALGVQPVAASDLVASVQTHLYAGEIEEAARAAETRLGEAPGDDQARFRLARPDS
ncbi:MAG TPA: hypothetical protein VGA77_12050 [Propylenella sp.]